MKLKLKKSGLIKKVIKVTGRAKDTTLNQRREETDEEYAARLYRRMNISNRVDKSGLYECGGLFFRFPMHFDISHDRELKGEPKVKLIRRNVAEKPKPKIKLKIRRG